MIEDLKNSIESIVYSTFNIKVNVENSKLKTGISIPLFVLAKELKQSPLSIYNILSNKINELKYINNTEFLNGFLNINIDKSLFSYDLLTKIINEGSLYSTVPNNNKTIVIDYSSPNIAKAFHFGHVRSTIIGNSLKLIYRKLGYNVVGINHLGDWGFPFGKILAGYKIFSNLEKIKQNPIEELQLVYSEYSKLENTDPKYGDLARSEFQKLESGDKSRLKLWEQFRAYSLDEFMKTYNLLGITFDSYIGEAFFNDKMEDIIKKYTDLGLTKIDSGALIIPLENKTPVLLKKQDGATLYITRDLAAIFYRYNTYHFDKILYVVGSEQKLHFEQLKEVTDLLGYNFDIKHINFGLVLIDGEKMSSRGSKSVKLMDVINEAKNIIYQSLKVTENQELTALRIALSAIIYNDLKNDRILDIDFDLSKMLKFEGNTGVYLMYSLTRINSILEKNTDILIYDKNTDMYSLAKPLTLDNSSLFNNDDIFTIIYNLSLFGESLNNVIRDDSPAFLARYLYNLCQMFSSFYSKFNINSSNELEKTQLLSLIISIRTVLTEGLRLLGIKTVVKM